MIKSLEFLKGEEHQLETFISNLTFLANEKSLVETTRSAFWVVLQHKQKDLSRIQLEIKDREYKGGK